ncbi:MAG: penicillin-binding protein 2 [Lachnospiraceae bacterium]|nr:penicillin-binding protein 2 [Lachnospiraceae bacterium]
MQVRRIRREKKKPNPRILKRMVRRLGVVFAGITVLFVVLIGRLMYIEHTSGSKYEKIVLSQLEYDSSTIPYKRGDIVDSKGTVLATSVDVYNVILDAKLLNGDEANREYTIENVARSFAEVEEEDVKKALDERPDAQYIVLAKKVSYEEMSAFQELADETVKVTDASGKEVAHKITGIWFEKEYDRVYPYGKLAASLLGFVSAGNNGVLGLENQFNDTLNGINGRSYGYLNTDNNLEKTVVEPENGKTIVTTIDTNIQSIVEKEIRMWNKAFASDGSLGSHNTACLVMDPSSGRILAMANYPTFDLDDPWNLEHIYSQQQLDEMDPEQELDALNHLWQNFCVSSTYEPGSTAKPFTVATGLETGTLRGDETYFCDGYEEISGYKIHCVNRNGHGMETVEGALMDSCNDALMQMSYVIGGDNFAEYQEIFGFGQKTNIDLPGEARTDTLIFNKDNMSTINLATNSFGQNFNTTMVQLASAFASLVNGGKLYQPYVVDRIQDEAGNIIYDREPVIEKLTISKETGDQMKGYLRSVVKEGTGSIAGVRGYDLGGKTGTAQKVPRSEGNYLVSFIGYAPQDNPKVLIYTIIDTPNTPDQPHSSYAQTITHNILIQILPYLNIETIKEPEDSNTIADRLPYVKQ